MTMKMKRMTLVCAVVAGSLVACKGGGQKAAPPAPSAAPTASAATATVASASAGAAVEPQGAFEQQTKWIRAFADAFNAHDADALARGYSMEGSTKWGEYKSLFADDPAAKVAITRSWHVGEVALFEFVRGGTSEAAGKKPYGYVGATLLWFDRAGQVTEEATYFDELAVEVQLGTAKPPASKVEVRPLRAVPPYSGTWEQHRASGSAEEAKLLGVRDHLYAKLTASAEQDFLAMMTDDVELFAYDEPQDAKGKKAIADVFKGWKVMFSDIKVEAEHSWACDGFAIFEGTFSGKHTGPWGPIKGTNREFKNHFVDVTRIDKDGKVDRMWTYSNNAELLSQILPEPAKK